MIRALLLVAALGFAGCVSAPTDAEYRQAQIGEAPTPALVELTARLYFKDRLLDYDSARFQFGLPARGYYVVPVFHAEISWHVLVNVNAKNAFGGYTGWRTWHFYFKDGTVKKISDLPAD